MAEAPTYRSVCKALHRPLTICGIDRRLFFLALLLEMGLGAFLVVVRDAWKLRR